MYLLLVLGWAKREPGAEVGPSVAGLAEFGVAAAAFGQQRCPVGARRRERGAVVGDRVGRPARRMVREATVVQQVRIARPDLKRRGQVSDRVVRPAEFAGGDGPVGERRGQSAAASRRTMAAASAEKTANESISARPIII
jgi:hypothetical protein